MDTKVTLSFDKAVIEKAKKYAESQNMSLSRLMEFLLKQVTDKPTAKVYELPVSNWVNMVAEGEAEYITPNSKKKRNLKEEFRNRK